MSARAGEPRVRVQGGWEGLIDLDFSPLGTTLAMLTKERLVIVDVDRGRLIHQAPLKRGVFVSGAVRYSADGRRLFVLAHERLAVFDAATAQRLRVLARAIDTGAYGLFAMSAGGLWIHSDSNKRMLVRAFAKVP